jgi:hypothetical protein
MAMHGVFALGVCRNGGASSLKLMELVQGGRRAMMTRSVRRRTGSGNGSLQEKPTGAEEEKMRGQCESGGSLLFF